MSHATIAMSPAVQSLFSMMPMVAGGAAGFAVTAAALAAAKKLHSDYECAKAEFAARSWQDQLAIQAEKDHNATQASLATSFGAKFVAAGESGTSIFLRRALDELVEKVKTAGNPEIAERAAAINQEWPTEALRSYYQISDELEQALSVKEPNALIVNLQGEIAQSALDEEVRESFEKQLEKLQASGDRNSSVVNQGIDNLKNRLRREMAEQAEREHFAILEGQRRRELAGEAFAMIRAVLFASGDPDEQRRANSLLNNLGATFQKGTPTLSELEALFAKARNLFQACEKRLQEAAAHAYVAESVKDVLLNMGYSVAEVPPAVSTGDPGCLVSVDQDTGIVVSFAEDGRMLTEMVAFSANGVDPDEEAEKRVCAVVDVILEGLRDRQIDMQEKSRKKLRPGHRLRRVEKKKLQELAAAAAKARSVE
jgi:hypothetical protein